MRLRLSGGGIEVVGVMALRRWHVCLVASFGNLDNHNLAAALLFPFSVVRSLTTILVGTIRLGYFDLKRRPNLEITSTSPLLVAVEQV